MSAEATFHAILAGDGISKTALSPYTRAVLDEPDLTPEDEAALERAAVTLAPPEPAAEPAPTPEPAPAPAPAPPEPGPAPAPESVPDEVEEPGSLPQVEHDDVETEELKIKHPPEAFRENFGFMFGSDEVVPDAYRIVLALRYKEDWLEWEPETLWTQIRDDLGPLSDVAKGKIMALRTCLKTNTPWIDWDAFEHVSQAFNDGLVIFGALQPPELEEAAYTVTVLRQLGDWPFGAEVSGYLAAVCLEAGLVFAPEEWFPSAQYFMDRQSKASPKLAEAVRTAWERLKDVDLNEVAWREDNALDNQVRKLWAIKLYIENRKLQPEESPRDTVAEAQ